MLMLLLLPLPLLLLLLLLLLPAAADQQRPLRALAPMVTMPITGTNSPAAPRPVVPPSSARAPAPPVKYAAHPRHARLPLPPDDLTRPMANFPVSNLPSSAPSSLPGGSLVPLTYSPLELGSIQPTAWLHTQLQTSASGLAGHEHDFYPFVASSSWLGHNQEYSALNEGFPYWFNALVPMAYTLNDTRLKAQVHSAADYVLTHQQDDGWIGPEEEHSRTFWGRYPLFLGLTNLADANQTWERPVVDALHRFNGLMNTMLVANYSGFIWHDGDRVSENDFQWGRVRAQDMMISLMWLLEKHPANASAAITQNLFYLHQGAINWESYWVDGTYIKDSLYNLPQSVTDDFYPYLHGVNVAQGLKAASVVRRFTHNESLVETQKRGVQLTYRYHGQSSGNIIADERSDGMEPYAGGELCAAVEAIYSHAYLYSALGDSEYADYAELATFNALPVMLTSDWWAHQYMAQLNQPYAHNYSTTPFYNVGTLANTYGLEPQYPCCTVNHPQGLPKFTMHAYLRNGDNGLVHALLSPTTATTTLASGKVTVHADTSYPFSDSISYTITAAAPFDFYIRQPLWATSQPCAITGAPSDFDAATGLHHMAVPAGETKITYTLSPTIRTTPRANDTIAIHRGALLYALDLGSAVTSSGPPRGFRTHEPVNFTHPAQAKDYEYTSTLAWNIALDPTTLEFVSAEAPAPGYIRARGCEIEWALWLGVTPGAPPLLGERRCLGEMREVRLVPYGGAKVHMAELPVLEA